MKVYQNSSESEEEESVPDTFEFTIVVDGAELVGLAVVDWNYELEKPSNILISQNILDALNITQNIFNEDLATETNNDKELSPHAACIQWCKKNYTDENGDKIRGRGACKFDCWVDTTIRVIDAISTRVETFIDKAF